MNRLRRYRMLRGLTQLKLGEKLHMTQNRICELERGVLPWPYEARIIADFFGVDPETLFPHGYKLKTDYNNGSKTHDAEPLYQPEPEPGMASRLYPRRDFGVQCWHCHQRLTMKADDYHPVLGEDLRCPACGARFGDIVPLAEAANV